MGEVVMNKAEYAEYETAVANFFEREGIENLTSGHITCPECTVEFDDNDKCPECGTSRECWNEPFFSWSPCDCCGSHLGGNREHATGYNRKAKEISKYTICEDCVYYAEYGRLDDTTMNEIERSES
jgi:hypothetical protein